MSFWLFDRMKEAGPRFAVATDSDQILYRDVLHRVTWWQDALHELGVTGRVISMEGDWSLEFIAALLAAMTARNIVVPVSPEAQGNLDEFIDIAEVEYRISPDHDAPFIQSTGRTATHYHYRTLQNKGAAGLVLFSSSSTDRRKAAVHNLDRLLQKFSSAHHRYKTLVFFRPDHIGGLLTLFSTLANGAAVVVSRGRMPRQVCETIARHRVQLLPTSPTFLEMLLLSEEHLRHNLSSLELITYGTEPISEATLRRTRHAFPHVRLLQSYGLNELGILRSQSREPGSLWMRLGGEGYETKIVDGRLWIRAQSILGYLNARNPFDAQGFLNTGDLVQTDGDWLRILGPNRDLINADGHTVFPSRVETTPLGLEKVEDALGSIDRGL